MLLAGNDIMSLTINRAEVCCMCNISEKITQTAQGCAAGSPLHITPETVYELLCTADKYDCPAARQECVDWLSSRIVQLATSKTMGCAVKCYRFSDTCTRVSRSSARQHNDRRRWICDGHLPSDGCSDRMAFSKPAIHFSHSTDRVMLGHPATLQRCS